MYKFILGYFSLCDNTYGLPHNMFEDNNDLYTMWLIIKIINIYWKMFDLSLKIMYMKNNQKKVNDY